MSTISAPREVVGENRFPFFKNTNFELWQKLKRKSASEASNIFHNIMQASVKGNPKPTKKKTDKKK
jgi:hypothetical protein